MSKKIEIFVGLVNGELDFYVCANPSHYGGVVKTDLFKEEKEARKEYRNVRRATLSWEE